MSRFTGPLAVTFLAARSGLASLDQPLVWEVDAEGSGRVVTIPAGFVSDGVTAPRFTWWLLPPWGHGATRAAILHDFALGRLRAGYPLPGLADRRAIHAEFRQALLACGVMPALALFLWAGTRTASLKAALMAASPSGGRHGA